MAANYTTSQGYVFHIGSVLQLSTVSADNPLTRRTLRAALMGRPIPHKLTGPGFMRAELGLALAHAMLAEIATARGIQVPANVSAWVGSGNNGRGGGAGWPATWNLPSVAPDLAAEMEAAEAGAPSPATPDTPPADLAPSAPASLALVPAPVKLLGTGETPPVKAETAPVDLTVPPTDSYDIGY